MQYEPHQEILSYEEITRLVEIAASLGIDRVRLTGGEPLVRSDVTHLVRSIRSLNAIKFIGMTTNGVLLPAMVTELKDAGVDGLNISLDTVDRERFATITRRDHLADVWRGLDMALATGFSSVKVNCVVTTDSRPEDWLNVAKLAVTRPLEVRYIEQMPMAGERLAQSRMTELKAMLQAAFGPLSALPRKTDGGPARAFAAAGLKGHIGFIEALSHCFCESCNRLRLTSTGDLKLCLFYDAGVALKPLLRGGASDAEIRLAMLEAVQRKPQAHQGVLGTIGDDAMRIERKLGMYKTGG